MSVIKFVTLSDLHLNHAKVKTANIVSRIKKLLRTINWSDNYKYIIIPGDVFERATSMNGEDGPLINGFISYLLALCYTNDLILYVLKGTGSHDGDQSHNFVTINDSRTNKAKLKYINTIDIWTCEYGLTWLGVPDEATASCVQTQAEVSKLLKSKGIESVDMGITHGTYSFHTMNGITLHDTHDADYYNRIVELICLNGHIHTTSLNGIIRTVGSFDRLRHGEDEAKGMHIGEIDLVTRKVTTKFIENVDAENFVTYLITETGTLEVLREVKEFIKTLTTNRSHLRLRHLRSLDINSIIQELQKLYSPEIQFTQILVKEDKVLDVVETKVNKINITPITKNTVMELMREKMRKSDVHNDRALSLLDELR